MLPLSLLRTAQDRPILVELKNGETYNGQLVNCDPWMNLNLKNVVCTAREGDRFWKLPAVYVRGNTIKFLCVPDEVLHLVNEEQAQQDRQRRGRGGRGGRGRGGSDRGGHSGSRDGNRGGGGGGGGGGGRGGGRGGGDRGGRGGGDRGGRGGGRGGSDRGGRGGKV